MGLHPHDLHLVAIYGFARCFTVIMLGAAIGNWIDRSERLSSTRIFLALQVWMCYYWLIPISVSQLCLSTQNILVSLACFLLAAFFYNPKWFDDLSDNPATSATIVSAIVITLATLANLASVGSKIVLEKDWTVVVAKDDPEQLASMNAVFRTLDLTTLGRSL